MASDQQLQQSMFVTIQNNNDTWTEIPIKGDDTWLRAFIGFASAYFHIPMGVIGSLISSDVQKHVVTEIKETVVQTFVEVSIQLGTLVILSVLACAIVFMVLSWIGGPIHFIRWTGSLIGWSTLAIQRMTQRDPPALLDFNTANNADNLQVAKLPPPSSSCPTDGDIEMEEAEAENIVLTKKFSRKTIKVLKQELVSMGFPMDQYDTGRYRKADWVARRVEMELGMSLPPPDF